MDKELKTKWVAALRSGAYSQTTGTLKDSRGYCCLGVLCDVVEPQGWSNEGWTRPGDEFHCESELSSTLAREIGLPASREEELIAMNDNEKKSFAEIADHIEKSL